MGSQEGIEPLVLNTVYEAEVDSTLGDHLDRAGNPLVAIINGDSPHYYYGYVVETNKKNEGERRALNSKRRMLMDLGSDAGRIRVVAVGPPYNGAADGPYKLAPTNRTLSGRRFELSRKQAFAVLKGKNIFYAMHIFDSKRSRPALRVYEYDRDTQLSNKGFGFLTTADSREYDDQRQGHAEEMITDEIMRKSEPGNYLIVRKVKESSDSKTWFFVPVLNFLESDEAFSPDGTQLVTVVDGYSEGGIIHNLPITSKQKSERNPRIMLYKGHVKRPEGDTNDFYYKPVFLRDLREDEGYVKKARIIVNGKKSIQAEKVE